MARAIHPRIRLGHAAAWAVLLMLVAMGARAGEGQIEQELRISAGPLDAALMALGRAYDVDVIAAGGLVAGKQVPAMSGRMTAPVAFDRVLANSGLIANRAANGAYVLATAASSTNDVAPVTQRYVVEEEIVVISSRSQRILKELTRSALILSSDDLEKFNEQTTSVQEILGKTIPGFAPPVTEGSAGSLTLRGRDPLF
ncbi:MAG: STN domain-containing protein, partial [Pseudomonadota bacterium]